MPWNNTPTMEQRQKFISLAKSGRFTVTELCLEFGISRKCGHKWLVRHAEGGAAALADGSRAPHSVLLRGKGRGRGRDKNLEEFPALQSLRLARMSFRNSGKRMTTSTPTPRLWRNFGMIPPDAGENHRTHSQFNLSQSQPMNNAPETYCSGTCRSAGLISTASSL